MARGRLFGSLTGLIISLLILGGCTLIPGSQILVTGTTTAGQTLTFQFLGSADSYFWDFGDGGTGSGNPATHVYPAPGTYTVKVTISVAGGPVLTFTTTVTIRSSIYWASFVTDTINSCNLASCTATTLTSTGVSPYGVALDGAGKIYWAEFNKVIKNCTISNCAATVATLIATPGNPNFIALDGAGKIYWHETDGHIRYCTIANCAATMTDLTTSGRYGIALDGADKIYWSDYDNGQILYCTISNCAATTTTLVTGIENPVGLALDGAGNIYWTEAGISNKIRYCTIASCTATTLISTGDAPIALALDGAGTIYWSEAGANKIRYCMIADCIATATDLVSTTNPRGLALGD